jgi:hypothetical protein
VTDRWTTRHRKIRPNRPRTRARKRKATKRKATKRKATKRKATKRKATKRKATKRKAAKRKPAAKRKAKAKRKPAAKRKSTERAKAKRAAAEKRSDAARRGWATRRARAAAADIRSLAAEASLAQAEAERDRLEAEIARKNALIREAAERDAREKAAEALERERRREDQARDLRRQMRIEAAKPLEVPPDPEEIAAIRTLMRDIAYRFEAPVSVVESFYIYTDNTVDARIKFRGFWPDWYMFIVTLSTIFQEDIVPNYPILSKWWMRFRVEVLERETGWRETLAPDTPTKRKFGKASTRVQIVRRLERSAMTFQGLITVCEQAVEDGKIIEAIDMWFYKATGRPTH